METRSPLGCIKADNGLVIQHIARTRIPVSKGTITPALGIRSRLSVEDSGRVLPTFCAHC